MFEYVTRDLINSRMEMAETEENYLTVCHSNRAEKQERCKILSVIG